MLIFSFMLPTELSEKRKKEKLFRVNLLIVVVLVFWFRCKLMQLCRSIFLVILLRIYLIFATNYFTTGTSTTDDFLVNKDLQRTTEDEHSNEH